MARRFSWSVFTFAATASLVLCVAVVVLWVRSYQRRDEWYQRTDDEALCYHEWVVLDSCRGAVFIAHSSTWLPYDPRDGWNIIRVSAPQPPPMPTTFERLGLFAYRHESEGGLAAQRVRVERNGGPVPPRRYIEHSVLVPYWLLAASSVICPLLWATRLRKDRRMRARCRQGLCPRCRYDLRASPGRCPECGAPVARYDNTRGTGSP